MNVLGNHLSSAKRRGAMDVRAALKEAMARLRAAEIPSAHAGC